MSALSYLQQKNGLKTTQTVVNKQQSGEDAEQKANPVLQASVLTENQLQDAAKKIDDANKTAAQDDVTKDIWQRAHPMQMGANANQDHDIESDDDLFNIPVVKQDETHKRMSYADMFKAMYGNGEEETEEQKKKRLKRERTNAIISSVGDGLRALSNMYFATKNAKVNHNPEQDMSATMLKRKQLLDTQREKNRAAWLKGYQKAQELDEYARRTNMTAAEAVRKGDQNDRKLDQNDRKLDQNQQKIDLTKFKYTNDKEYKDNLYTLDKWYKENKISIDEYNATTKRMEAERRSDKAAKLSGGDKNMQGLWYEYLTIKDTPDGKKKVREILRRIGAKDVNQHNIRYIMDKLKGRSSSSSSGGGGGGKNPSQHNTTRRNPGTGGKKRPQPY